MYIIRRKGYSKRDGILTESQNAIPFEVYLRQYALPKVTGIFISADLIL